MAQPLIRKDDSHGRTKLLVNGRFFFGSEDGTTPLFANCMLFNDSHIEHVGSVDHEIVVKAKANGVEAEDIANRIVLPAFFDGHVHLLQLGQALQKVDLTGSKSLEDIRERIGRYAKSNPADKVRRILCKSWMVSMTDGKAEKEFLTDIEGVDGRPIYIDEKSLHSTWCNEAALQELGVNAMSDPPGGEIHRDSSGKASGLLSEDAVFTIVWPHLARLASMDEKVHALSSAVEAYIQAGYTGIIDMAMNELAWDALLELRRRQGIRLRIAAHWLIMPADRVEDCLRQVDRAIHLQQEFPREKSPDFYIAGIKLICDGIVDSCTAALMEPYSSTGFNMEPLWEPDMVCAVVRKADEAGLQCALHAIGDKTVRMAIDALESNSTAGRRHRIEHLELTSAEDASRLGKLGITASIQPVHSDPAILRAWPTLLGEDRCSRAFAYKEFLQGGANISIGTDAPTAPHLPLPNLYTATTRQSAREPDLPTAVNEHFALTLSEAVSGATRGTAYSCFAEEITGSLKPGLSADFVVLDMEWAEKKLLQAKVVQTWFKGEKVFDRSGR